MKDLKKETVVDNSRLVLPVDFGLSFENIAVDVMYGHVSLEIIY